MDVDTATIKIAFEIKGKPTRLSVEAELVGALAVHPTPMEKPFWTITHVKTGCAVFRFFPSREVARRIALKLGSHPGWKAGADAVRANEQLKTLVNTTMRRMGFVTP